MITEPVIGIDVTAAVTQGGGIGRYTRELIRAVVPVAAEGTFTPSFRLFSARPPATLPVPDPIPEGENVSYHPAPISDRWLYRLWHRLRLPLAVQWFTGRLSLFHSPDFVLPPVRGDIPTLLTVHDLSFVHYPQTFTPALVAYLQQVVPQSVARASHILADSEATRNDLISLWNVPSAKITVLYSGVSRRFQPVRDSHELAAVREKYGIGAAPYLFSISTLQPRKNYDMLIRAFRPVANRHPHHLVIAGGKGWLYEEMLAEVERQGLQGRVHFIGFAADEDLPALYSGASVFVFPSLYEGFGLPVLEAMACGVPVLASSASSLPEVGGEAAIFAAPDDQESWSERLDQLLYQEREQSPARVQMVADGLLQAQQFTWERAARQLLQIYEGLLE